MAQAEVQALNNYQAGLDEADAEVDPILKCIQWLFKFNLRKYIRFGYFNW
jgi:hypothetical protein